MMVLKNAVEEINVDIQITTPISKKINKVYIIRDSFYDAMDKEIRALFKEVKERNIFTATLSTKELLENKPDVFIYEIVERHLDELKGNLDEDFYK